MAPLQFRAWHLREPMTNETLLNEMVYFGLTSLDGSYVIGDVISGYIEDKTIVMQSTGLHDKNGKEIFEGDIVKNFCNHADHVGHFDTLEVIWEDLDARFKVKDPQLQDAYQDPFDNEMMEVIGNIYETPELLL